MSAIQVFLEVPSAIQNGLLAGTLERVGGVVRETGSKEIVMWLRESGQITQNPDVAQGLLASVLQSSGMSSATIGVVVVGALNTLNIALTGYTLYKMISRIKTLEAQITYIHDRISKEFARDRQVNLETALASARDMIDAENAVFKQQSASRTVDKLFSTRQHLFHDIDALLAEVTTHKQCQEAQIYLLQAMQVDTMRIRCYLETEQYGLAKSRLSELLEVYQQRTSQLIRSWLGQYPAMYFHEAVTSDDLQRYINIEKWLRNKDEVLMDLINEYRHDFWNKDAIKAVSKQKPPLIILPLFNTENDSSNEIPSHIFALNNSEILIENYQRLLGFELELASMRLEFKEWNELTTDIEDRDDYVALVDVDLLEKIARLS